MSPKLGKNQLEGTLDLILTMPPESEAGLGKGDMVLTLMLPPEAGAGAGADLDLSPMKTTKLLHHVLAAGAEAGAGLHLVPVATTEPLA